MYETLCEDYYTGDYGETLCPSRATRVARKRYRCCECRAAIEPGQQYVDHGGLCDGAWFHAKVCLTCQRVADDMLRSCPRDFGELWNIIHESYCDEEFCLCPPRPVKAAS